MERIVIAAFESKQTAEEAHQTILDRFARRAISAAVFDRELRVEDLPGPATCSRRWAVLGAIGSGALAATLCALVRAPTGGDGPVPGAFLGVLFVVGAALGLVSAALSGTTEPHPELARRLARLSRGTGAVVVFDFEDAETAAEAVAVLETLGAREVESSTRYLGQRPVGGDIAAQETPARAA